MKRMRPCDYEDGYDPPQRRYPHGYKMRPADYDDGFDPPPVKAEEQPPASVPDLPRLGGFLEHIYTRVYMTGLCESPIEVDLGTALLELSGKDFEIHPQYCLGRYRFDFAVFRVGGNHPACLVECDGAEFHQTKKQLANDKAKDAAAIAAGTKVVRLTGKEIYRDPRAAARIVIWQCGGRPCL